MTDQVNVDSMPTTDLKALVYDRSQLIQKAQFEIEKLNEIIASRPAEPVGGKPKKPGSQNKKQ